MLAVKLNCHQLEYDIHSLVKAFYPQTEVKVFVEGEKSFASEGDFPFLSLELYEDRIVLEVSQEGKEPLQSEKAVSIEAPFEAGAGRTEYKNELKKLLYHVLSERTGHSLPWGTLTGIRPTRIPMTFLEEGKSEEDILAYMQQTYEVSREKGELAIEIAKREKEILSPLHYKEGYSLYLGIPFCPTTCLYCSFTSFPISAWQKRVDEYLTALEKEMDYVAEAFRGKILDSVYIGGGTPTTLEPDQLRRLLARLTRTFDFSQVKEFTIEAGRADSITREKLSVLKEFGVDRISVNPQTMNEETLKRIGRRATAAQVVEAFRLAREVGFSNINMDLILGLPGETEEDVAQTMEKIGELRPDSLTIHSLAVKRASKLSQWIEENGITALKNTDETMKLAVAGALEMGMKPYYLYRQKNMSGNFENVGYAAEGKFGLYNILMMEEVQSIAAIGAGTISKRVYGNGRIERCENVKEVAQYIERIEEMIERKRVLFED